MNWLDIIIIIVIGICIILGIIFLVLEIIDDEIGLGIWVLILGVVIATLIFTLSFCVIDKASGSTIGIITSVDKNFFGTTALYIKTTETNEEMYCIEFDDELEEQAKNLIGNKVKINYGKRVGIYSIGKCHQAPIESIEEIK